MNTRNYFFGNTDDECLNYFHTLGALTSSDAVNEAALQVCLGRCQRYFDDYVKYLTVCRVVRIYHYHTSDPPLKISCIFSLINVIM